MRRVSVLLACLWLLGWSAGWAGGSAAAGSGREVRLDAVPLGFVRPEAALTAATPEAELQIVSDARYDVQPASSRVRITVDATISNTHKDTPPVRSYYDTGYLAVLPGTANFAVTSPGAKPTVTIRSKTATYTLLAIHFGRRLYGGHHTPLRLTFNLPDKGGAAVRDVRIGTSLIAFPAWSFATTGATGGSVTVVFPAGYNVQVQAGAIPGPSTGASRTIVYASGTLAAPLSFYAYFVADRPGTFKETSTVVDVSGTQVPVVIRAWADDAAWGTRVSALVRRGLPALGAAIGLAYGGAGARRRGGGQPDDRWLRGPVRPGRRDDRRRVLRRFLRCPARGGARLVQRAARVGALDQRGLRLVVRGPGGHGPEGRSQASGPDQGAPGGEDSAQRMGGRRPSRRGDRGLRLCRDLPARRVDRETGRHGRAPFGLGGGRHRRAGLPAAARDVGTRGRRDAARLARPAGPAGGANGRRVRRPLVDLGPSTRGGSHARRPVPGPIRLRGGCGRGGRLGSAAGRPRGDVGVAVRPGRDPDRRVAGGAGEASPRSRRRPPRPGSRRRRPSRPPSRAVPDRLPPQQRRRRSSRRSTPSSRRRARRAGSTESSSRSDCLACSRSST